MSDVKEVKLNAAVVAMASRIKPHLTLGDTGTFKADKEVLAASCEGTDVTPEMVALVNDHITTLVSAGTLAVGELAEQAFAGKENRPERLTGEMVLNKGLSLGVSIAFSKEVPNMDRGNPGFKTVYGATSAKLTFVGTKNRGDFKHVRAHIAKNIGALAAE